MLGAWWQDTVRTYRGNAIFVRDFRSQMRGWKPMWFWLAYLGLILLVVGSFYSGMMRQGTIDVGELQTRLVGLFVGFSTLLSYLVLLVAPALTAISVVQEFDRKSIDLVQSAPVSARYLLVGRLLSAYRYVWILLMLALPFAAVGILMGGFTWPQLLATFFGISLQGLLVASLGLVTGVMTRKIVPAVIQAYASFFVVGIFTGLLGAMTLAMTFSGGRGGASGAGFGFWGVLTPGTTQWAVLGTTPLGTWQAPNLLLATILTLFTSRLFMLGAASAIAPTLTPDISRLRANSFIAALLIGLLAAIVVGSIPGGMRGAAMGGAGSQALIFGNTYNAVVGFGSIVVVSYLACWGFIGERKYQTNGIWRMNWILKGTPASALPYLTALMVVATLGFVGGMYFSSGRIDPMFFAYIPWAWGLNLLLVGMCWWASLLSNGNLPGARRLAGLFFILFFVIISAGIGIATRGEPSMEVMAWNPIWGAFSPSPYPPGPLGHGIILAVIGGILLFTAEMKRRKVIRASYE